ncbi:hypothetical protein [Bacillus sp. FJAT-49711]
MELLKSQKDGDVTDVQIQLKGYLHIIRVPIVITKKDVFIAANAL